MVTTPRDRDLTGISVILFDAGDTLVRPGSGHWYVPPRFNQIISSYGLTSPKKDRLQQALAKGYSFLDANHLVQTEAEELEQFTTYYRIVCSALGAADGNEPLYRKLSEDMVYNDDKFVFFPDVHTWLPRLSEMGYTLGVLSNTWPSLKRVFSNALVYEYFKVFVISSQVGCFKPAPPIYRRAVAELNVVPEEILFIDDSQDNLDGGRAEGMNPLMISRYGPCKNDRYPCITELCQLPLSNRHSV